MIDKMVKNTIMQQRPSLLNKMAINSKVKIIISIVTSSFVFYMLWVPEYFDFIIGKIPYKSSEKESYITLTSENKNSEYLLIWKVIKNINDPSGWRNFKWGMSEKQTIKLGAKPFRDNRGKKRFGLANIELFPEIRFEGNQFWVDLGFYSHIGLASILIKKKAHRFCLKKEYEIILKNLREEYGAEKEEKDLEYPNVRFLSHIWVIGFTKIQLNHSCAKRNNLASSSKSFLLSILFERRYGL